MDNKESFEFTYSAKDQAEIQRIRKKYTAQEEHEDKMAQLRRLDKSVYSKAASVALTVGIIGTLVMGIGMSIVMTDIAKALDTVLAVGIGAGIGIVGMCLACLAYPLYNFTLKKERKKVAPEIIRLTDELMK